MAALFEKVPAGQLLQDVEPGADPAPALQLKHTLNVVAATTREYVPALQLTHEAEPAGDHVPATHDEHTDKETAPTAVENEPAAQAVHAEAATTDDHDPAAQAEQDGAPALEKVPAIHGVQKEAPSDDVPALQLTQAALTASKYMPLGHRERIP
jgi:hypothetical protein